jgi:hypothetical protein
MNKIILNSKFYNWFFKNASKNVLFLSFSPDGRENPFIFSLKNKRFGRTAGILFPEMPNLLLQIKKKAPVLKLMLLI